MAWPGGKAWFDGLDIALELAPTNAWNAAPTFVDITAGLQSFSFTYGRSSSVLEQPTAGRLTATLVDNTRTFDQSYTSSPFTGGGLDPGRQVRLRARFATVEYNLGYWWVVNWRQIGEPANALGMVELTAIDSFDMLSTARVPLSPLAGTGAIDPEGGGERVDQRIARLLDYGGYSATLRDLDTDCPTVRALELTQQNIVLQKIQAAAGSDFGIFFIGPQGNATYRGRRWQDSHNLTAAAVLGENRAAGEFGYTTSVRDFGMAQILNHIKGSAYTQLQPAYFGAADAPSVLESVDIEDTASSGARGERFRDLGTLDVLNANVLQNVVEYALAKYKDPVLRTAQVTLRPRENPTVQYPVLLAAHMGTRFTLNRRPQNVGSVASTQVVVEGGGMSGQVKEGLDVNYWLSETTGGAGLSGVWIVGVSKLGTAGTALWA